MLVRLKDTNTIGMVMDFMCSHDLNYEVVKDDEPNFIKVTDVEETCGGCPTIFEFKNEDGDELYFRLRHGCWRLENESKRVTLLSGDAEWLGLDGTCSWNEAQQLIAAEGLYIVED